MKIYKNKKVLDASLERIRYLFDEFENVVVGFSGGKDSTVVLNLSLQVAREKNRLPLPVMWIDQEAEWQGTVDYCTSVFNNPDIKPYWFQMPMVITNNATVFSRYSYCWNEEDKGKWIHPKNEKSIKVNKYGTERFHKLFEAIFNVEFSGQKSCYLSGVRTEESPKRFVALTYGITYKWITWGKVLNKKKEHYTFYPIYDWSYTDIWLYLHKNKIQYNKVYDEMYKHGVSTNDMRISNLHHETAIQSLLLVQEIEPKTWEKIVDRVDGVGSIKQLKKKSFTCPDNLPDAFISWEEYCYYLAENLIQEDKNREKFLEIVRKNSSIYIGEKISEKFWKSAINTILSSDWDFTKIANFVIRPDVLSYRRFRKGEANEQMLKSMSLFTAQEKKQLLEAFYAKQN